MANEITSTVTSELYTNIVQAALFTYSEGTVIRPLVRQYDMTGTPGLVSTVPKYPAVSAADLTENTDITANTAFNTTEATITAVERGAKVLLTDVAKEAAQEDIAAAIGRQLGDAMAKKVDTDIAALFPSFSNRVGAAGDAVTVDTIFDAIATLRNANAQGQVNIVLHPFQTLSLKKQLTGAAAANMTSLSDLGNQALRTGFVGTIGGANIFDSTVVGKDTNDSVSGTGNYVGLAFTSDAIGFMMKRNVRLEVERDASLRAEEIVGSMSYGSSELFDEYGVGILGSATV